MYNLITMDQWIRGVSLTKAYRVRGTKQLIKSLRDKLPELTRRKHKDQTKVNKAFNLLIANFVLVSFSDNNLIVPNKTKEFEEGGMLANLYLTRDATRSVLMSLEANGFITKIKGSNLTKLSNLYKPTSKLTVITQPLIYCVVEKYKKSKPLDYVIFKIESNKEKARRAKTRTIETTRTNNMYIKGTGSVIKPSHPDVKNLHKINCYLSNVEYALKAPIRLVYTGDPFHGGRLYTPIQTLPNRIHKVRTNTKINNEPICEVDLSSNHPSMSMALSGKKMPSDFYQIVSDKVGLSYEVIKDYIIKAIGARNRKIKLNGRMTKYDTANIDTFIKNNYPDVFNSMYKGMGSAYQSLEGQILMKAMLTLIDQDIPSLPVHDAIIIPQRFKNNGKKALENAWMEVLDVKFKPYIKFKMP